MVDIYYHFHYSVNQKSSLHEYAEFCSTQYRTILKHCETRWLSLRKSRMLDMWDPVNSYFTSHPDVEKPGKVITISRILTEPLTKPWLYFLLNTLTVFDKFNTYVQISSTATIHRLHGESERLLKTVLSFFIKPEVILQHTSAISEIIYTEENHLLPNDCVFIGDETTALLLHISDNEGEAVGSFYKSVIKFYQGFVKRQLKVFDFKSQVSLFSIQPKSCVYHRLFLME